MGDNTIRKLSLKDPAFINDFFERCHLAVSIDQDEFVFALLDDDLNKYIRLDSFASSVTDNSDPDLFVRNFENALQETGYLGKQFKSVKALIETPFSTLVPGGQFDKNRLAEYLRFANVPVNPHKYKTGENLIKSIDAHTIFMYPQSAADILKKYFPGHKICHQSSVMISAILALKNSRIGRQVYLNIRSGDGDILYLDEGKLRYFNSFTFRNKADFVFYTLETLHRLHLDPEFTRVMLMGQIQEKDEMYPELFRFIKTLSFIPRNSHFQYSNVLESLPPHPFFNLMSLPKCEL